MARGRKKSLSLNEQLEQVNVEISETEEKLKELRLKRKQLQADIEADKQKEILSIISGSRRTMEEIKLFFSE